MKYLLATLALTLPFVVGQAAAQEQDEERPRRDGEMRARMIEEFDADGDGELNDEERQTARETMRERRGDRPGRGGQARGGEGRGRGPGRGGEDRPAPPDPNQLFDRFDENKDGQLSRDEFLKLTEETRGRRGPRGPREGRPGGPRGEDGGGRGPRGDRPPRPQRTDAAPADDSST
jgi:hypothetical protein